MFFDCATACRQLERLKAAVRPGGVAAVNVLIEGTTWLEAFGGAPCCLMSADDLRRAFDGRTLLLERGQPFEAPDGTVERFAAVIARRRPAL